MASHVDAGELVDLVRAATQIPSVTPNETNFAEWVHEQLSIDTSWDHAWMSPVSENRPNVYARVGNCDGRSLVLAGHLDTVHADDWEQHWTGTKRADPFAAHMIDGEIWGRGVTDQKAGIAITIAALRAINRAGYRTAGPVTALFVCDEESGQPNSGVSAGMRAAIADDVVGRPRPDFLIYTEPTTSAIYTAQMGFLIADITLEGRSAYFGRPEQGVDALKAGHHLLDELWRHSKQLRCLEPHPLIGEAFLLVTQVQSGGNIAVPGLFELSLIRKILPSETMEEAAESIRQIAASVATTHKVQASVDFSAGRDHPVGGTPDETPTDHPAVVALAESIAVESGHAARIEAAPYWSEKPFLSAIGVPGVYFGPGDISHCHTPFEHLNIAELVSSARVLTRFIAKWCSLKRLDESDRSSS